MSKEKDKAEQKQQGQATPESILAGLLEDALEAAAAGLRRRTSNLAPAILRPRPSAICPAHMPTRVILDTNNATPDHILVLMNGYVHSFSSRDDIIERLRGAGQSKLLGSMEG